MASFSTAAFDSVNAFDVSAWDFGVQVAEDTPSKLVMPDFDDGGVDRRRRKRKKKEEEIAALEALVQLEPHTVAEIVTEVLETPVQALPAKVVVPQKLVRLLQKPVDSKLAASLTKEAALDIAAMQLAQSVRIAEIQQRRQQQEQEQEDEELLFQMGVFE